MASVISVSTENQHTSSRVTRDGRKITYKLNVIQRPLRARACGQGAKSSSDRRPVDPPPIVDLQVLEGDEQRDITFTYNANFFLFASLEKTRHTAQGRVPPQNDNQPVLTGTPVAGMAYLDRPTPAGYFIFPDLSVRHEGQYRLTFTLYEEVKDPKDADAEAKPASVDAGGIGASIHGRCEVKSSPFSVYSAKKFPGLTESTPLSRTVADQGCRVRIRRDVRMRRRADKSTKDWDDYEDESAPQREQRSASPDGQSRQVLPIDPADRARSTSNAASASSYQQLQQAPRRTSNQELHTHYNQSYVPQPEMAQTQAVLPEQTQQALAQVQPHTGQQQAYMPQQAYQPSIMAPYPAQYQQPFMAQPHMTQAPMQQYQAQQYPYPQQQSQQPQTVQPAQPVMAYGYMPQPMYESNMSHMRQDSVEFINGGAHPNYQRGATQYPSATHTTSPSGVTEGGSLANGTALPPLARIETGKAEGVYEQAVPPPTEYTAISARPVGGTKRSFGSTFSMQHVNEPLRGGARPDVAMQEVSDGSDEDLDWNALKMSYRRADGTRTVKTWPPSTM